MSTIWISIVYLLLAAKLLISCKYLKYRKVVLLLLEMVLVNQEVKPNAIDPMPLDNDDDPRCPWREEDYVQQSLV